MNKDMALTSIVGISRILKKHGAKHWLTDGTLLGYYREKDFISHDTDTDIGCMIDDLTPELIKDFLRNGFALGHVFGKMEDGFEIALHCNGIKTDIFFFYERGDELYHSAYGNITAHEYTKIDYAYKFFDTKEVDFLGHKFFVPEDPLLFIETKYGADWKVPKKAWRYDTSPKNAVNTGLVLKRVDCEREFKIWAGL